MNLSELQKSSAQPKAGDVFVFQLRALPDRYFFGRVMRTDVSFGPLKNMPMIYLYRTNQATKLPVPALSKTELLTPPIATNALPWSKGYFETVASIPVHKDDLLERHCFKDSRGRFFDDDGRPTTPVASLPIGDYGLHSYRTIDDAISKALNIPLAPD